MLWIGVYGAEVFEKSFLAPDKRADQMDFAGKKTQKMERD
jgi:hypothetical protein